MVKNRKLEHFYLQKWRDIMVAMGKIIVKEDTAEGVADKDLEVTSKKKSKSTVKPGSELVLASTASRAVAVAPKTGTKKAGAKAKNAQKGTKLAKNTDGVAKKSGIKVVDLGGDELMTDSLVEKSEEAVQPKRSASGAKTGAKSVSGMVIDGTIKSKASAKGAKLTEIDAEADDYALDEEKLAEKKNAKDDEPEFQGEPRFTKGKSALIGVGVALAVAIVGFVGIWFFSRKPVESCVVRFESNGGSYINSTEMVCGNSLVKPADPTKEGFDFQGWVYDGVPFDFANDTVEQDMILVAKWSAKADTEIVRVRFDTQGGTAIEGFDIAKGKTLNAPITPTKAGYVFDGWYLGDERFDFLQEVYEDITLTAHWKEAPNQNNSNNSNGGQQGSNGSSNTTPAAKCDYLRRDDPAFAELKVGVARNLTPYMAYLSASECRAVYKTSNESVMKIENDRAIGMKPGDVSLTICLTELSGGKELDCVKIGSKVVEEEKPPVAVTGVSLNQSEMTLEIGGTYALRAYVAPNDAANKGVTWSSSNSDVVMVSGATQAQITAVSAGEATITVRTVDGGFTASCKIIVKAKEEEKPEPPATVPVDSVSISGGGTIKVGDVLSLVIKINPDNATNKNVVWSSSIEGVATVSADGKVTGVSVGKTMITATVDGKSATVEIVVEPKDPSAGTGSGSGSGSSGSV